MHNKQNLAGDTLAAAPKPFSATSSGATDVQDLLTATDTRRPVRLGLWVLVVGFGGFLAWAAWAPLDEGVAAPAMVSIETKRKTIQHMNGGVIKQVPVKEGQAVQAGDTLIVLDDAGARANFESIRQNYMAQRAAESRLLAEQQERPSIDFHPDLLAQAADPLVKQHMATQTQLFNARRLALTAELAADTEAIAGLQAQWQGMTHMLDSRSAQARQQAEQLHNISELAREGYAPRNQMLQLEQSQSELRATMADLQSNQQRIQRSMAELRQRMALRKQEYHKEEGAQLADVRREVQAGQDKLKAISDELDRTRIKAPVAGQVVGLALGSSGGVVTPGQHLMDIVPQGEALMVDAKVPPQVIDRIHTGDAAEVRFSGFAHSPQLVLDAKVVSLSRDVVTENVGPQQAQSYYLARVQVSPEGFKQLGQRTLQPGMPAEVLIKTGERSLLTYLLHPLTKRIAAAMKEE
jgi:protease secretion system membrane fusion protein